MRKAQHTIKIIIFKVLKNKSNSIKFKLTYHANICLPYLQRLKRQT